jgi:hypothetical protein
LLINIEGLRVRYRGFFNTFLEAKMARRQYNREYYRRQRHQELKQRLKAEPLSAYGLEDECPDMKHMLFRIRCEQFETDLEWLWLVRTAFEAAMARDPHLQAGAAKFRSYQVRYATAKKRVLDTILRAMGFDGDIRKSY